MRLILEVSISVAVACIFLVAAPAAAESANAADCVKKESTLAERFIACHAAAKRGTAAAVYYVGAMYEEGQGVPQDHDQASRWYRRAADKGDVRAQVKLGFMYALGKGVPQNYTEAHRLMNVAAAGGHQDAAKVRDLLAKLMKPDEIREAQHRALGWWIRMHPYPSEDD